MSYRKTNRYRQRMAEMGRASQRKQAEARMSGDPVERWKPPELRREIVIIDHDMGEPKTYRMELRRSDRIDCYDCFIDGKLWKRRIGWSRVQEWIRKAFPRISIH